MPTKKQQEVSNLPLPGLYNPEPYVYKTVFFGAKREWENEDEGWEPVRKKRRGNHIWRGNTKNRGQ